MVRYVGAASLKLARRKHYTQIIEYGRAPHDSILRGCARLRSPSHPWGVIPVRADPLGRQVLSPCASWPRLIAQCVACRRHFRRQRHHIALAITCDDETQSAEFGMAPAGMQGARATDEGHFCWLMRDTASTRWRFCRTVECAWYRNAGTRFIHAEPDGARRVC